MVSTIKDIKIKAMTVVEWNVIDMPEQVADVMRNQPLGDIDARMEEYLDVARVTFIYDGHQKVSLDFMVIEGAIWKSVAAFFKDKNDPLSLVRPWAKVLGLNNYTVK